VVDPQRVDQPLPHQPQHELVRRREDLGVLLADADEIVDVEEPPVTPGGGIDVEELRPQLGIGPEPVGVIGGHVVGHDVEDHAEAGVVGSLDERAELALAAQIVRQPGRVDDVVAVGRA
jgi:hypothetical protein